MSGSRLEKVAAFTPSRGYRLTKTAASFMHVLFFCLIVLAGTQATAQPVVASLIPITAASESLVTISGSNFGETGAANIVYFGAVRAQVLSGTVSNVVVVVPLGATYAPVSVTVAGLTGYSPLPFVPAWGAIDVLSSRSFGSAVGFAGGLNNLDLAMGDFDLNGWPDLAAVYPDSHAVTLLTNAARGTEIDTRSLAVFDYLPADADSAWATATADFDGDGRLDLVVADLAANRGIAVLQNISVESGAAFAPPVLFETGPYPIQVAVSDFDADGRPDIAVANYGNNFGIGQTVSILRNTHAGQVFNTSSFGPRLDFSVGGCGPDSLAAGDIDGDGKPELVVANWACRSVTILRNTTRFGEWTTNAFVRSTNFLLGVQASKLELADLDADGRLDLVVLDYGRDLLLVLKNLTPFAPRSPIQFAQSLTYPLGARPSALAIGDLNGDGRPDLAVGHDYGNTNHIRILQNTSSSNGVTLASVADLKACSADSDRVYDLAIGDINGDQRPDLVVASSMYPLSIRLLENRIGSGVPPSIVRSPTSITVALREHAELSVVATGDLPLSYEWRFEENTVALTPEPTLFIAEALPIHCGAYRVVVSNAWGMATSAVATLAINLVSKTADWRFFTNSVDIGSFWREPEFDDGLWPVGRSLFYAEESSLPWETNTPLALGAWSYRFRHRFHIPDGATPFAIRLGHVVDDGAVVYLNGREIWRTRMGVGPVIYDTPAVPSVDNAVYEGPFELDVSNMIVGGENVLAAEVHQWDPSSSDIVFGVTLDLVRSAVLPPLIVEQPVPELTVTEGGDGQLRVVASGTKPLEYRWRRTGSGALAVGTNATLLLTNVQLADAGYYFVEVNNSAGTKQSALSLLTVLKSPGILEAAAIDAGEFHFAFTTVAGRFYTVEASTNLVNWSLVLTTNAAVNSFRFNEPRSNSFPQRFYRVKTNGL